MYPNLGHEAAYGSDTDAIGSPEPESMFTGSMSEQIERAAREAALDAYDDHNDPVSGNDVDERLSDSGPEVVESVDSDTMFGVYQETMEEQIESAARRARLESRINEDVRAAEIEQERVKRQEREVGARAKRMKRQVQQTQQARCTLPISERRRYLEQLEKEKEKDLAWSESTTVQWTRHRDTGEPPTLNTQRVKVNLVADNTYSSDQHLRVPSEGRRQLSTARLNPDPEDLTTSGHAIQLTQASPPLPQDWRTPQIRTHLKLSLNRIHTEYLLTSEFIDDINEMLNYISNWPREDAKEIMKSFENDPVNEGRSIRFVEKTLVNKRQWRVKIQNPRPSVFHPRVYENSHRLPLNRRSKRVDRGIALYGVLPPCCQNGCDPGCPRARTKADNEKSLLKGRKIQQMEKIVEAKRVLKSEPQNVRPTAVQKRKDMRDTSPPHRPIRESGAKARVNLAYGETLLPWIVNVAKLPGSSPSPPSSSASSTATSPSIKSPKLLSTAAEWEKLEPAETLATPRLENSSLTTTQQKRLASVEKPSTPRLNPLGLSLTTDQWENVEPLAASPTYQLSAPSSFLTSDLHKKAMAGNPYDMIGHWPKRNWLKARRTTTRTVTRPKKPYFTKALPPSPTRSKAYISIKSTPSSSKNLKASYDLIQSKPTLLQMLKKLYHNEQPESWKRDPDRH
jgi:hypothetical protein